MGFTSPDEASYWQGRSCGVLCLKMAIEALLPDTVIPIGQYIKQGLKLDAYIEPTGWKHDGLVRLAISLGVQASAYSNLEYEELDQFRTYAFRVIPARLCGE